MIEMPVERAEYMHPPVQCCFQHRITLLIVGNQPSATLWINQLREILKSLCVLLDVRWRQRPQDLQAGIIQPRPFRATKTATKPTRDLPIPKS